MDSIVGRLSVVAGVDVVGDYAESRVAQTLRRLEQELELDPHIADAVLTMSTRRHEYTTAFITDTSLHWSR